MHFNFSTFFLLNPCKNYFAFILYNTKTQNNSYIHIFLALIKYAQQECNFSTLFSQYPFLFLQNKCLIYFGDWYKKKISQTISFTPFFSCISMIFIPGNSIFKTSSRFLGRFKAMWRVSIPR